MQIQSIRINPSNLNRKTAFKGNEPKAGNDDDNYVKISKTENTINKIGWSALGIWALLDIFSMLKKASK